jgi:hypothetical protein
VDPCVVGTWIETSHIVYRDIGGKPVQFKSTGLTQRFSANGLATVDYDPGNTETAAINGHTVEIVATGTITWRYTTHNGQIVYSDPAASGSVTVKVDGVPKGSSALQGSVEPDNYTCAEHTMTQTTTRYTIRLHRVTPMPSRRTSIPG